MRDLFLPREQGEDGSREQDVAALCKRAEACVVDFLRRGFRPSWILELFRNPVHDGPHKLYVVLGDEVIRNLIKKTRGMFEGVEFRRLRL